MKKLFTAAIFLFFASVNTLLAQSPIGVWKTIDDETGQAKSHVEIFENNGKLYAKIVKLLQKSPDSICEKCRDDKKNQKVVGMIIVNDMTMKDGYYQGGSILDPNKGDYYKCSFWLQSGDSNVLNVKGKHWSGLSRTQKWYRVQ